MFGFFEIIPVSLVSFVFGYETTHDTGCPRPWFRESIPGRRIGLVEGEDSNEGVRDRRVEGKARDER